MTTLRALYELIANAEKRVEFTSQVRDAYKIEGAASPAEVKKTSAALIGILAGAYNFAVCQGGVTDERIQSFIRRVASGDTRELSRELTAANMHFAWMVTEINDGDAEAAKLADRVFTELTTREVDIDLTHALIAAAFIEDELGLT